MRATPDRRPWARASWRLACGPICLRSRCQSGCTDPGCRSLSAPNRGVSLRCSSAPTAASSRAARPRWARGGASGVPPRPRARPHCSSSVLREGAHYALPPTPSTSSSLWFAAASSQLGPWGTTLRPEIRCRRPRKPSSVECIRRQPGSGSGRYQPSSLLTVTARLIPTDLAVELDGLSDDVRAPTPRGSSALRVMLLALGELLGLGVAVQSPRARRCQPQLPGNHV